MSQAFERGPSGGRMLYVFGLEPDVDLTDKGMSSFSWIMADET